MLYLSASRTLVGEKKITVVFFFELQAKSNTVEQAPAAAAALEIEAGSAEDDQVGKFQIPLVDINFFLENYHLREKAEK